MRNLIRALIPCALIAASPLSAQVDPGYRTWIEQPGYVVTVDGDYLRYIAYRTNPDGSVTYRLDDRSEVTLDQAEIEQSGKA